MRPAPVFNRTRQRSARRKRGSRRRLRTIQWADIRSGVGLDNSSHMAYACIVSGVAISHVRAGMGETISMSGGFTHFAGGSVTIEMGGTAAGQFGRITINGPAHSTPLRAPAAVLPSTGDGDHF